MAKRSNALASLIIWARAASSSEMSPGLPTRIRNEVLYEGSPASGGADPEVAAWRQMLAVLPLDAASFKGLYGSALGMTWLQSTDQAPADRSDARRGFLDDLARCCERQMDEMSDDGALGYLAVLFLTLLTMEDADDRRFDDLADWGVRGAGAHEPARRTAAQQYAGVCERLFAYDEVGEALRCIYEPEWAEYRGPDKAMTGYNAQAVFEGGQQLPADPAAVRYLTAKRAREIWAELDFEGMQFHRCGTTSFIIRTPWRAQSSTEGRTDAAVKFVLLPYAELAAIERATSGYLAAYGPLTHGLAAAVQVRASTRNLIVTDFIEGDTLTQRVQQMQEELRDARAGARREPGALARRLGVLRGSLTAAERSRDSANAPRFAQRKILETFMGPLFEALEQLNEHKLSHQDLNPSNIIVIEEENKTRLKFIDFGRNYLYDQAGLSREGADAVYIAPEIRSSEYSGPDVPAYFADVYSLGQLLIALSGVGRDAEGVVPDAFYRRTPLLARFLEDLIERDPTLRLLLHRPAHGNPYTYLSRVCHANYHATLVADRNDGLFGPPTRLRRFIVIYGPASGAVRRLRRLRNVTSRDNRDEQSDRANPWWQTSSWLYRWSMCSSVTWYGCFAVVGYLMLADLRLVPAGFLTALALPGYEVPPETLAANLTARFTGITFCLAAVKYYQNVYSNLTTRVLPPASGRTGRLRFWTEFWVRWNAFFVALVVVPVNLLQPAWWTFGSAAGLIDSLMVNFTGSLFALSAVQHARTPTTGRADRRPQLSTVPQNIPGLSMYRMWAPSMLAYVGIVLFFAVLINSNVLKDDLAYASVVSVLNITLFTGIKCGINAEPVRIGLTRAYLAAERLSHARQAGLFSPAAAEAAPARTAEALPPTTEAAIPGAPSRAVRHRPNRAATGVAE
ncbi:protein kinase domain-containing protein [Actinoplanes sp. URMC 104]|uniref:protein kinase domain-containing protein n=1 Tax=Actinoplanes sp. URMC 104 TaxID=3423409 RepID=UPI003F1BD48B